MDTTYGMKPARPDVLAYCQHDVESTIGLSNFWFGLDKESNMVPKIKKVIFNNPATIVFWADGTKTVVKCQETACDNFYADGEKIATGKDVDRFDPEKGLAMAIAKKALGNKHDYYNVFKKHLKKAK